MTYELFIGDRTFSSWSMRGWLMLEAFGLPYRTQMIGLYSGTMPQDMAPLAPARTVPAMRMPDGGILSDSLAMAETLVEAHPDIPFYPSEGRARALARSLVCEMHSGFTTLRGQCPQILSHRVAGFAVDAALQRDLDRIMLLWDHADRLRVDDGPWLFGAYTLADVFFAPVAGRMATYGLPINDAAQRYVQTTLADPAFRRWRAMGLTKHYDPAPYPMDLEQLAWPGPTPLPARAIAQGSPVNETCPYSGDLVTDLAEIAGQIYGFCNPFCRDKTVNDPEAWPAFMELHGQTQSR